MRGTISTSARLAGPTRAAVLAGFVGGWDATALYFVFPAIRDGLADGDAAAASWVLSVTSIVAAAVMLQAGRVGDRIGHVRAFRMGTAGYLAGAFASTLAPSLWFLVGARALQAMALALQGPASMALILGETTPGTEARAMGRWGAATAVAGVLGPISVAVLLDSVSWRVTFALQIPMAAVLLLLIASVRDRPDRPQAKPIRPLDSALTVAGLVALIVPIVEGDAWGWADRRTVLCLAVGVLILAIVVSRSRDRDAGVLPLHLLASTHFTTATVAATAGGALFFAQWIVYLLFLTDVWGYGLITSAILLTLMPGTMAISSVSLGTAIDRLGARWVLVPVSALYTATITVFALTADEDRRLWLIVPMLVAAGLAMSAIWPSLNAIALRGVPSGEIATAAAFIRTISRIGSAAGVAAGVALASSGGDALTGSLRSLWFLAAVAGVTTIGSALIPARED
ncbi:MAG: MFS transporter [Actinomycetota bacterium]